MQMELKNQMKLIAWRGTARGSGLATLILMVAFNCNQVQAQQNGAREFLGGNSASVSNTSEIMSTNPTATLVGYADADNPDAKLRVLAQTVAMQQEQIRAQQAQMESLMQQTQTKSPTPAVSRKR